MAHTRVSNMLLTFAQEAHTLADGLERQAARGGINRDVATKTAADLRAIAKEYEEAAGTLTTETAEAP